mmetsp:Transcript_52109/g.113455  ORF Transcript_52109/g.113455 Transcript_52109/m.113455 type:complete len:122 (-) Transcript_52109:213-578(-)
MREGPCSGEKRRVLSLYSLLENLPTSFNVEKKSDVFPPTSPEGLAHNYPPKGQRAWLTNSAHRACRCRCRRRTILPRLRGAGAACRDFHRRAWPSLHDIQALQEARAPLVWEADARRHFAP